jgi:hypothetical protein
MVSIPQKRYCTRFSVEPLFANAGGGRNKRSPIWSGVATSYHLAQFFHQYPSVTQPYCIPHDISQVQSRLMDLFGRLDKCIPRTRKGVSLISRGMRLLCLTVPQILQQVLSIFVRSLATPCRRLAGRSHWLLLWNAVRYC